MQKEPDWCKTGLYKYTVCCESICVCYCIYFRWLKERDYREFLISVVFGSDTPVPLGVETAQKCCKKQYEIKIFVVRDQKMT